MASRTQRPSSWALRRARGGAGSWGLPPDHLPELVPRDGAVDPVPGLLVVAEVGVGDAKPRIQELGDVLVQELLADLVVGLGLDAPAEEEGVWGESVSWGPAIIRVGHHQRFRASWTIRLCFGEPLA